MHLSVTSSSNRETSLCPKEKTSYTLRATCVCVCACVCIYVPAALNQLHINLPFTGSESEKFYEHITVSPWTSERSVWWHLANRHTHHIHLWKCMWWYLSILLILFYHHPDHIFLFVDFISLLCYCSFPILSWNQHRGSSQLFLCLLVFLTMHLTILWILLHDNITFWGFIGF